MNFAFDMDEKVNVRLSGEKGEVTARAEFIDSPNQYLVSYTAADGRFSQAWFTERDLIKT